MENTVNWIDLPIIEAFEYFQGLLGIFMRFARKYGTLFGFIGLVWSAFKLINSRIAIKQMIWDTMYKWLLFIFLINFYAPATTGISILANKIGTSYAMSSSVSGGADKTQSLTQNLARLKNTIERNTEIYRTGTKDKDGNIVRRAITDEMRDLAIEYMGMDIEPLSSDESAGDYLDEIDAFAKAYKFSSRAQKKSLPGEKKANLQHHRGQRKNSVGRDNADGA